MKEDNIDFNEWEKYNPKMKGIWDELEVVGKKFKSPYFEYESKTNLTSCCMNWPDGIPAPFAVQRRGVDKKKSEDLGIFNEMMKENIRPSHFKK